MPPPPKPDTHRRKQNLNCPCHCRCSRAHPPLTTYITPSPWPPPPPCASGPTIPRSQRPPPSRPRPARRSPPRASSRLYIMWMDVVCVLGICRRVNGPNTSPQIDYERSLHPTPETKPKGRTDERGHGDRQPHAAHHQLPVCPRKLVDRAHLCDCVRACVFSLYKFKRISARSLLQSTPGHAAP